MEMGNLEGFQIVKYFKPQVESDMLKEEKPVEQIMESVKQVQCDQNLDQAQQEQDGTHEKIQGASGLGFITPVPSPNPDSEGSFSLFVPVFQDFIFSISVVGIFSLRFMI